MKIYANVAWTRRNQLQGPDNSLDIGTGGWAGHARHIRRLYRRCRESGASSTATRDLIWEVAFTTSLYGAKFKAGA